MGFGQSKNTVSAAVSYFGKLPAEGDFVSSHDNQAMMGQLDRWTAGSLEALSQNPDWKQWYDNAPDIRYAFMGPHSRMVVFGCLLPSHDATKRRFPFLTASQINVGDSLLFIGQSPLALHDAWEQMAQLGCRAMAEETADNALAELTAARYRIDTGASAHLPTLHGYLARHTLRAAESLLATSGHNTAVFRQMLPALGLLLQPVQKSKRVVIDKGLELPLPQQPEHQSLMAAFWLDLIAAFLGQSTRELAVLIQRDGTPRLVFGFNGADDHVLRAVFDPHTANEYLIRMSDSEWIEEELKGDHRLNKLASYLDRNDLSLSVACESFRQTFLES